MRRLLLAVQCGLLAILCLLLSLLLFHEFGRVDGGEASGVALNMPEVAPGLEQMRTWSDLIVQRTLFSPNRGKAVAAGAEGWAKDAPPFELVAVFAKDGGRVGIFVPAGANRATARGNEVGAGGRLSNEVSVVEIRENSAVVRKKDGLFELKLPRAGVNAKITINSAQ